MSGQTQFLIEHGGPVLFGVVLLEQAGLPLPALPWLVAAGALAASGKVNPFVAVGVTLLACLVADSGWFYVGRRSGKRGLGLLCRMSLEPNRCVSRSEGFLARHAEQGLVAAKFLPWLGMVVSPLAGSLGMSYRRFLLFDAIGSLLYASYGILLGFVFGEQLQQLLTFLGRLGLGVFALALGVVLGYVGFKILKWRRAGRATQSNESELARTDQRQDGVGARTFLSAASSEYATALETTGIVQRPEFAESEQHKSGPLCGLDRNVRAPLPTDVSERVRELSHAAEAVR
jgi:membrane protein DedA with SNARE-associated domain